MDTAHYIDLVDGDFDETTREDLAGIFRSVAASSTPDNIVIHFHGGLVSRASAMQTAQQHLRPAIEAGGGYPIFVVWNSDLKTTITENLGQIAKDPVFHRLVKRVLQFVLSKYAEGVDGRSGEALALESLIDIPDDIEEIEKYAREQTTSRKPSAENPADREVVTDELESDDVLVAAENTAAGVTDEAVRSRGVQSVPSRIDRSIAEEIRQAHAPQAGDDPTRAGFFALATVLAKYGYQIFSAVIRRLMNDRDHGVYTTIVEEILRAVFMVDSVGAVVWSTIKNDTADGFRDAEHGASALVDEINDWWRPGRRVTLVGHSTGAIYIGHLLEDWHRKLPGEALADVVFLAPACTFQFLHGLANVFETRVRKLIVFGLSDDIESSYWEVPLYRGSLLYMVSGLLEPEEVDIPLVGMQRYYQGDPYNQVAVEKVKNNLIDEIVWSVTSTSEPGRSSDASEHGDFEGALTLKSLTHIVKHGV